MFGRIFNRKKKLNKTTSYKTLEDTNLHDNEENKDKSVLLEYNNSSNEITDKPKTSSLPEENIFLSEEEIQRFIKKEAQTQILEQCPEIEIDADGFFSNRYDLLNIDKMFIEAAKIVVEFQQGSTSLIQRKLSLGYNRAGRIMDQLEAAGILGPFEGSKARQVLIKDEEQLASILQIGSLSEKKAQYFNTCILPTVLSDIEQIVTSYLTQREEKAENELKEQLRQEILKEEQEKQEKKRIKELKEQLRQELVEQGELNSRRKDTRSPIPQTIQDRVWNRDNAQCVNCGSNKNLEFDHIIPISRGGANTYRNLQLLCEKCNRQKSNKIGSI